MEDKKLGRREFLRLTVASAAAAGLSHFQILNLGSGVAFAQDQCDPAIPNSDSCDPQAGVEDQCFVGTEDADLCVPTGHPGQDYLCPDQGTDLCVPQIDPDLCYPATGEQDVCDPQGDLAQDYQCREAGSDVCQPPDDADLCAPPYDPDEECTNLPADTCQPPGGGQDLCYPATMGPPDICEPGTDPDACLVEIGDFDVPPTAIEMASFNAGWTRQGVEVEWETAGELDSLGFNLYRSLAARSGYQQINASLIPCQSPGTPLGAAYSYLDGQAQSNTVYYYVIESLDAQGRADRYGPVQASPLRRLLPTRRRPAAGGPDLQSR